MVEGATPSELPEALPSAPVPQPALARDLLAWYDRSRRTLPWRPEPGQRADPYAVWLSEIMLQQTTVRAVTPYYRKFLERWPSVAALAAAPTADVMQAWAGLGYYARARNLHACARAVAQDHAGVFPDTENGLRDLPGIGRYTAAAIAAFAFGRHAVVVDGNVERVMARLQAVETPLPKARPALFACMAAATPEQRAGDFAQAVMDLGATLCTPKSPACTICPVRSHCAAATRGVQGELPRRSAKPTSKVRHGTCFYVTDAEGAILVRTRPPKGLLGGMVELPGSSWTPVDPPATTVPTVHDAVGRVTHVFTHFTLLLDVVVAADARELPPPILANCRWVRADRIGEEALPTLMRHAIKLAQSRVAA